MRKVLTLAGIVFIMCVSFAGWGATWYVNSSASEFGDGTSPEKPLETIQEGIDVASDGDAVIVAEGTYAENVQFKGKNIVLTSTDPSNPTVVENTIVDGSMRGSVVTLDGTEDETCVLSGFTIQNGFAPLGGGINGARLPGPGTHARIERNIITSNRAEDWGGAMASCDGIIQNNTISDNSAYYGGGLYACDGIIQNNIIFRNRADQHSGGLCACGGIIQNNIVAGNSAGTQNAGGLGMCDGIIRSNTIVRNSCPGAGGGIHACLGAVIENCIVWGNSASTNPQVDQSGQPSYCCIQSWTGGGTGNINQDPQFVDYTGGDYHLSEDSPCIDAGANQDWMWDAVDLDGNPRVIGAKVDIGAYEFQTPMDTSPPYVSGRDPAPNATRVPLDANIALQVKDHGTGVDQTSILMRVNGLEVIPTITGTPADYTLTYDPPSDFSYSEEVTVTVDAADLSSPANVMPRVSYSFTTIREPSPVETWYVDGSISTSGDGTSWETAFKTIQEGIEAANNGDTVIAAKGTYAENIVFRGRNITLRSTKPLNPAVVAATVIDGSHAGPVVTFTGTEDETCVLSGFTVRNGLATHGGGICGGTVLDHTHATIEHNVITANSAVWGGGLSLCAGTICDNTVSSNSVTGAGGALWRCDGVIERNSISGNSALLGGGLSRCDGIVSDNLIFKNSGSIWVGGLLWCEGTIRNNVIAGNSSALEGGGLECCNHLVENNTIVGNSAPDYGGGVAWCVGTVRNCIIWGNSAGHDPQVYWKTYPTYCCIQDWTGGGEGNIAPQTPGFVDPDGPDNNASTYEDNDYRLGPDSPCIDKGKNEDWMLDAADPNGNPRIIDFDNDGSAIVDMGAYEAREYVPPVLTLNGDASIILECGAPYIEPGYTATDDYDGDITDRVVVSGWVDPTSPGIHNLRYNVKDFSGNAATEKVRLVQVRDTTPPVITLIGDNPMTIQVGTPYVEPGYTATDSCDGDVTAFVVPSGSVDSNVVGTYTLIYTAIDRSVNLAQVTRTVNVVEVLPPTVVIVGLPDPDGAIQLSWTSSPDATYTVWSCVDLVVGPLLEEATILADAETTTWTDLNAACLCKFYRIEIK